MKEELILSLDLIYSKIGYILASLSSYSSLNLSKRIDDINQHIYLIKKSIVDNKDYVDIRDVIKLQEQLKELEKNINKSDQVSLKGHKIACLLFEVSTLIKLVCLKMESSKGDMIEYLQVASEFLHDCGRIVNIEILCYENIIK